MIFKWRYLGLNFREMFFPLASINPDNFCKRSGKLIDIRKSTSFGNRSD